MNQIFGISTIAICCLMLLSTACEQEDTQPVNVSTDALAINTVGTIDGRDTDDFEKNIINPIVYLDDCECPVAGTVEFIKDGELLATIDFGDGTCDELATKTADGETSTFDLDCDKKDDKEEEEYDFEKVITNPIVELDDCDCPVAGTIEFYKEEYLVYTLDYGDGACDNLATKIVEGEAFTFEMEACE